MALKAFGMELPSQTSSKWPPTICMVPMELRRGNEKCYDPVAVKIGLCRVSGPCRVSGLRRVSSSFGDMMVGASSAPAPTWVPTPEDGAAPIALERKSASGRPSTDFLKESEPAIRETAVQWLEEEHQDMERYKSSCVVQLISRWRRDKTPDQLMKDWFSSMKRCRQDIQDRHSNPNACSEMLVALRTMLVDGCFILHRLLKYARLADDSSDDDDWTQIGGRCFVWQLVSRDLLLLENQIPFFVVCELFQELKDEKETDETLLKGSFQLFRALCPQMLRRPYPVSAASIANPKSDVHHLLHLFYLFVGFPSTPKHQDNKNSRRGRASEPQRDSGSQHGVGGSEPEASFPSELPQWIPGAKELLEAGIRLRERKNATTFLDIKFDIRSGVLEIPPLQLYDHSEPLFRNMIAFEQTYPHTRCDISIYSVFMNCLVSTAEDARILHLRGILVNMMNGGDQDGGRHFFDRICSQIHFPSDNYLVDTMAGVNRYMRSRRHRWRAALVRDYFSNPWVAISVVAAVFLLCLTVLQTVFTVYPYFKPSK